MITDTQALDDIHAVLNGNSWSADTMDTIAYIVRSTGRIVGEPRADTPPPSEPAWVHGWMHCDECGNDVPPETTPHRAHAPTCSLSPERYR